MAAVVGVAFRDRSRHYWFDPAGIEISPGDRVVVETARGPEIGTVRREAEEVPEDRLSAPLKRVLRQATPGDEAQLVRNHERARNAFETACKRVRHFGLPMKLLSAEYTFDCSQVVICFTAENRVDFRELVKDLAGRLRTRVQLYQVGARDHTRMLGGYGTCGRELCCRSFLTEFAPVSMRMAKDQSLFLNPARFSGACGKLMCCLRYEHETYTEARTRLPSVGSRVDTAHGSGKVVGISVLRCEVAVSLDETASEVVLKLCDVHLRGAQAPGQELDGGPPGSPPPRCDDS
jgi:cell fate regulator YaaT (PSP1 superfamily)